MIFNGLRFTWQYTDKAITCVIQTDEQNPQIVTTKNANCSSKDRYIKEKGRRLSLDKSLRSDRMYTYLRSNGTLNEDQIRKFRGQVWEAYRIMTKIPRW